VLTDVSENINVSLFYPEMEVLCSSKHTQTHTHTHTHIHTHTYTHTHTWCRCLEVLNKFYFVWLPQILAFITLIQSRAVSILQHSVGGNEVKFDSANELGH